MTKPFKTVAEHVAQAKKEILADAVSDPRYLIARGFEDLHDLCDANGYGGFFEVYEEADKLREGEDDDRTCCELLDDNFDEDFMAIANQTQEVLHVWIASGEMRLEAEALIRAEIEEERSNQVSILDRMKLEVR